MFVHLRISKTMYSNVTKFSVLVNCGRGLVLLWQQCSILCTSGFVDDVMFAHNRQGKSDANTACVSPGGQHGLDIALAYGICWRCVIGGSTRREVCCLWLPCLLLQAALVAFC